MPTITIDELEAEWRRLGLDTLKSDEGKSAQEWADEWGICKNAAIVKLRRFKAAGWVATGTKIVENLAGRQQRVPCHQIEKKKGKK